MDAAVYLIVSDNRTLLFILFGCFFSDEGEKAAW
jgi:hypothetical protein